MNIGGLETFIMNLLRNIDRDKFKFIFLTYTDGKYDYEDEINELGGKIVRIHTPKFGLLFDNLDAITEDVNGNIEINDMYIGESDMCADLSIDEEESSDINRLFNQERKYAKVVSNYLK